MFYYTISLCVYIQCLCAYVSWTAALAIQISPCVLCLCVRVYALRIYTHWCIISCIGRHHCTALHKLQCLFLDPMYIWDVVSYFLRYFFGRRHAFAAANACCWICSYSHFFRYLKLTSCVEDTMNFYSEKSTKLTVFVLFSKTAIQSI